MHSFLACTLLTVKGYLYAHSDEVITSSTEWVVDIENKTVLQMSNTSKELFKQKKSMLRKIVATSNKALGIALLPPDFHPTSARINIACEKVLSPTDKVKEVNVLINRPIKGPDKGKPFVFIKERSLLTMGEAKELARKVHGSIGEFEELWSIFSTRF